ncbi:YdcH family protein [Celeribacter sp.]|uniref:YdcH family protein n=1 Tax=Celeribacter sp. TaxID=1890673 RepID=UPI003A959BA0
MSHTPHQLSHDFPELADAISERKASDPHFAHLLDDYNALNDKVHLAETNVEPMDDLAQSELRKKRMALKDKLYGLLTAAA